MAKQRMKNVSDEVQAFESQPQEKPGSAAAGNGRPRSERDRIAQRAYELYLARGGSDGLAEEDWFNAERELSGGTIPTA